MKNKTLNLCLALMILWVINGYSQTPYDESRLSVVPPSPEAVSLGKYGNMNVSSYTGQPNVSIPIHTVSANDLNLNVNLSYNADGLRADEIATWVGLGWTLNGGGAVIRSMRGHPDEIVNANYSETGWLRSAYGDHEPPIACVIVPFECEAVPPETCEAEPSEANIDEFVSYAEGGHDGQPDIFFFNAGGYSGKFIIKKDWSVMIIPNQKINIDFDYNNSGDGAITAWNITLPNGIKYSYTAIEQTKSKSVPYADNTSVAGKYYYNSAWYLTKIESPSSDDQITIEYTAPVTVDYTQGVSDIKYSAYQPAGCSGAGSRLNGLNKLLKRDRAIKIAKITHPNGVITFEPGSNRLDLNGDKVLDRVVIKDKNEIPFKQFDLEYEYRGSNENPLSESVTYYDGTGRLFLKRITEIDQYNNEKAPYEFEYYWPGPAIPEYTSLMIDHWGFYNGELQNRNNNTLIPQPEPGYDVNMYPGANRTASFSHTLVGTLRKIIYPTGGASAFEYEQNQVEPTSQNSVIAESRWYQFETYEDSNPQYDIVDYSPNDNLIVQDFEYPVEDSELSVEVSASYATSPPERIGGDESLYFLYMNFYIVLVDETAPLSTITPRVFETLAADYDFESNDITRSITLAKPAAGKEYRLIYKVAKTDYQTIINEGDHDSMFLSWVEHVTVNEQGEYLVGGIRVTKTFDLENYSNETEKTNEKIYHYQYSDGKSSGQVINYPTYVPYLFRHQDLNYRKRDPLIIPFCKQWYVFQSSSVLDLSTTSGGIVGYERVEIEHLNNGKSILSYTSPHSNPDMYVETVRCEEILNAGERSTLFKLGYPWPSSNSKDWQRGKLLYDSTLTQAGDLVKLVINDYDIKDDVFAYSSYCDRVITVKSAYIIVDEDEQYNTISNGYQYVSTGVINLEKSTTKMYDGSNVFVTEENYEFSDPDHLQLTRKSTTDSNNQTIETILEYPLDIGVSAGVPQALFDNNMHATVINSISKVNSIQVEKVNVKYTVDNGSIVPSSILTYPQGDESAYRETQILTYEQGRVTSFQKQDGLTHSLIWSYSNQLPIVKADNIDQSTLQTAVNAAFNSLSGSYSDLNALMDALVGKMHGEAGNLRSVWDDFNTHLRNNATLANALIASITYDPLIGMTSQTDPNNVTVYYEYDDFGRLKHVRDQDSNVLSKNEYHYRGQ